MVTSEFRRLRVGLGRVERPTSRLSGVRSNHLSYRPSLLLGPYKTKNENSVQDKSAFVVLSLEASFHLAVEETP